jgi:hypothetical protein
MLIDVAIPGDRNVIKKETEKILKYKDLTIEIQRMRAASSARLIFRGLYCKIKCTS